MGDDEDGNIRIALYLKIIKGYRDGDEATVRYAKAKLERQFRFENMVKNHILFSSAKNKIVTYAEKVREMNDSYEDMLFELSDNSNESIKTIRDFSVEEMVRFNTSVYKKLLRKSKHGRSE